MLPANLTGNQTHEVFVGDAWTLATTLPRDSIQAIVTSPPYWRQRRYTKDPNEFGQELSVHDYAVKLAMLLLTCGHALRADGAVWLNLGDSIVDKRQVRVGHVVVDRLEAHGWILRREVIFERLNFAPRSSEGAPTLSYERVFLLTPDVREHYYDAGLMREPAKYAGYHYKRDGERRDDGRRRVDGETIVADTRNIRSVWTGPTGWNDIVDHPALMPRLMAERCVLSVTRPGDLVLDPFSGGGTTGVIALEQGRRFLGFELHEPFAMESSTRLQKAARQTALPLL
jgi:DNA modification methylase